MEVITYTIAKNDNDRKFLRDSRPVVCVFDEGRQLKSAETKATK